MSDDEYDFLSEIAADPDEPFCKLVYADWLDERNDPRAELIRVQMARREPLRGAMSLREKAQVELAKSLWWDWLGMPEVTDFVFREGVPAAVFMRAENFVESADRLFEKLPTACGFALSQRETFRVNSSYWDWPEQRDDRGRRRIVAPTINEQWAAVFDSQHASHLNYFEFDELHVGASRKLVAHAEEHPCREVIINGGRAHKKFFADLTRGATNDSLRHLRVCGTTITNHLPDNRDLRPLDAPNTFPHLRRLDLHVNCDIARNLVPSGGWWNSIEELQIERGYLPDPDPQTDWSACFASPPPNLAVLKLRVGGLTQRDVAPLLEGEPHPWELLDLQQNRLPRELRRPLKERYGSAVKV